MTDYYPSHQQNFHRGLLSLVAFSKKRYISTALGTSDKALLFGILSLVDEQSMSMWTICFSSVSSL